MEQHCTRAGRSKRKPDGEMWMVGAHLAAWTRTGSRTSDRPPGPSSWRSRRSLRAVRDVSCIHVVRESNSVKGLLGLQAARKQHRKVWLGRVIMRTPWSDGCMDGDA